MSLLEIRRTPSLGWYLAIALLLRLPAVLWARGYEFLDHQFQYVDPAYHLAFDADWWRPWEYERGMRSWVYPGLLAGMFRALHWLGCTDPELRMTATRFLHSLFSLLPLALLWQWVVRWRPVQHAGAVLWLVAVSGVFVYQGVQPNGPMWAAQLSVAAVLCAQGPRLWHALLAGGMLGLALGGRFQDGLFAPAIGAVLVWQRRWPQVFAFSAGFALLMAGCGLVDWWTWGRFLHSALEYVQANLLEGKASSFGSNPIWQYVPPIALVVAALPFLGPALRTLRIGFGLAPALAWPVVVYVVAHALLERKAVRFISPALMLLTIVVSLGVFAPAADNSNSRWQRAHTRWFVLLHLLLALVLSLYPFHRGPVTAAKALAARPQFQDRLLLVSPVVGGQSSLGGYYYLDRRRLQVEVVQQQALAKYLLSSGLPGIHVMAERQPLQVDDLPVGWQLEDLGCYVDWLDLRPRNRRFLYWLHR